MPGKTLEDVSAKKQAIIEAAREIFARQGYETTTIAEIASAARVAVGTVYLYFRNKRDIYTSISLHWTQEIAAALRNPALLSQPVEQVPRALIEECFRMCRKDQESMSLFQVDLQSPEEIKEHRRSEQIVIDAIEVYLQTSIAQGHLDAFDTTMYAQIIFETVHGILFRCFCIEDGANEERYRESLIEFIQRLFFGPALAPRP